MRRVLATLLVAAGAALACDGASDSLVDTDGAPRTPFRLTVVLGEEVPTFKVEGRLRLVWESASIPVGGVDLGVVALPAGEREATFDTRVPFWTGVATLREETFTPAAPFLCGTTDVVDPRETPEGTATLALCQP